MVHSTKVLVTLPFIVHRGVTCNLATFESAHLNPCEISILEKYQKYREISMSTLHCSTFFASLNGQDIIFCVIAQDASNCSQSWFSSGNSTFSPIERRVPRILYEDWVSLLKHQTLINKEQNDNVSQSSSVKPHVTQPSFFLTLSV